LAATQAVSFFVTSRCVFSYNEEFSMELHNNQTEERLVIEKEFCDVNISRYPIGANKEWIKEMRKGSNFDYRTIIIDA
jgi:hypothetical protein